MKILGFDVNFAKTEKTADDVSGMGVIQTARPHADPMLNYVTHSIHNPIYPLSMYSLYQFSYFSSTFGTIITSLDREIFKNGIKTVPVFSFQCSACLETYTKDSDGRCDKCGGQLWIPNHVDEDTLEKWKDSVNKNGQTLGDVLHQIERDIEVVDNAFLVALKEYDPKRVEVLDFRGNVKEFIRGDPLVFRIQHDPTGRFGYDDQSAEVRFCVAHRDSRTDKVKCPSCQLPTQLAFFRTEDKETAVKYYGKDEVIHIAKYNPTITYGIPVFFSVWVKVAVLMNQDKYAMDWYFKQRPPNGLLTVNTNKTDAIAKTWDILTKMVQKNPHAMFPIATGDTNTEFKWVNFGMSLQEMQYIESRNEFKREIGARFGVMPVYLGDVSTSGGFNSEREQTVVTSRAVEMGQEPFNKKIFPWLNQQLGVTDYIFKLEKNEEAEIMAEVQIEQAKAKLALAYAKLGFDVDKNAQGEFVYKKTEPSTHAQPNMEVGGQIPQDEKLSRTGDVGSDGKQDGMMEKHVKN
jgi:hypothetical protein